MPRDKNMYTPMMQQYLTIKDEYEDAFLFFRLGDFYELFFEDAQLASKELEITLTSRAGGDERIPMCGVPHHASGGYIDKLIAKGYKVAICEQIDDPKTTKGMVRRAVTNVITPGTVMAGSALNEKENNYLIAVDKVASGYVLAYADLTTGEAYGLKIPTDGLISKLIALDTREIIVGPDFDLTELESLMNLKQMVMSVEEKTALPLSHEHIAKNILDNDIYLCVARLVNYIGKTQESALMLLQPVKLTDVFDHMMLDANSRNHLELTQTMRGGGKKGSLLWLLDVTKTAMGARLLKRFILNPLIDVAQINRRLNHVSAFKEDLMKLEGFRRLIDAVYDLERLIGRVATNGANGRDLEQLALSLEKLPEITSSLYDISPSMHEELLFHDVSKMVDLIKDALVEDVGIHIREGGIIRDGYNEQLDEYRHVMANGKDWLLALEQKERERSGIKSLKIKYNKVFGYHIEVSTVNLHLVTEDLGYIRKQTLSNCERFVTTELKEKEDIILNASDRSIALEYELFVALRTQLQAYVVAVQENAAHLAYLDVMSAFAFVAAEYDYTRPSFSVEDTINVVDGRHPVVEKVLGTTPYVPNGCEMPSDLSIFLITGPNMSGKSTYMRQMALMSVMAQIGSFVPATEAVLPVFDQIFTRIGAGDDLTSGQSTFMVEMMETNYALSHATKNSLILLDEIGRGTATFDGMALAQGIIEYIHEHIGAKTLFATHYHELTELSHTLDGLQNLHVRAKEYNGKLIFLHKVSPGASDKSYGVHVARIAQLPKAVTDRAKELLAVFEANGARRVGHDAPILKEPVDVADAMDELLRQKIRDLDVNVMTPVEALLALSAMKEEFDL